MDNNAFSVIVVGGGLVGSLSSCFLARRGYNVQLYEYRNDIRTVKRAQGRSINLTLSHRGRLALRKIGLEDEVLKIAIPIKGRFLHNPDGNKKSIIYDPHTNQCIYSIRRNCLNALLLTAAESCKNVRLNFNYKLIDADVFTGQITLLQTSTNTIIKSNADLIIGADGAFSALRQVMQRVPRFDFSQTYIDHGYIELSISAVTGKEMVPNHVHIWPRGQFMMVAFPNTDGSWTVTLFMPFRRFEELTTPDKLLQFFRKSFPDTIPLIGEQQLVHDFFSVKPAALVSIKCSCYHAGEKMLILGDAAHAMVPFYGQGMNAGFEDCVLLDSLIDKYQCDIHKILPEYTQKRKDDGHAICELAMYNYKEMRELVTRPSYHIRKKVDETLNKFFPDVWMPRYNAITFSNMGYTECIKNRNWQNQVLIWMSAIPLVFGFVTCCVILFS